MRVIPINHRDGPKYEEFSTMLSHARREYVSSGAFRFVTHVTSNTVTFNRWLEKNHGFTFDYGVDGITSINIIDEQKYLVFLLRYNHG